MQQNTNNLSELHILPNKLVTCLHLSFLRSGIRMLWSTQTIMVISLPNEVLQLVITLQTLSIDNCSECYYQFTHRASSSFFLWIDVTAGWDAFLSRNSKSTLIYVYWKHARRNLWPNIAYVSEIYIFVKILPIHKVISGLRSQPFFLFFIASFFKLFFNQYALIIFLLS